MLQRAASNAYSWWWASHIRTKQSKWLEQNLQDMEEKVQSMLKLISEDGDSFARRAEMYYKRRPELITFVEESYRAYRSLAERYDHISTELQNANNAIATYFPDQVQFAMDDDDDDYVRRNIPQFPRPPPSSSANVVIPKVPKAPLKDLKSILSTGAKKFRPKKESEAAAAYKKACSASNTQSSSSSAPKSGLTKPQALQKIDNLQKDILGLQTVKEFVKSSYEGSLAKYWEIEDQITSMQADASSLQDEFNETVVIDDDEARSLMTSTALKSCQDTLSNLQHKHHNSVESAKVEQLRIKELRNKLNALTNNQVLPETTIQQQQQEQEEEEAAAALVLEDKIKQHYNIQALDSSSSSSSSLSVAETTEKIDELVNKVISLETAVSSQDANIARLKNEADDLQSQIHLLDKDNGSKLQEMEHKLKGVENLSVDVKKQNVNLHTHFTEAKCNLQYLYKVHSIIKSDGNHDDLKHQHQHQHQQELETTTGGSLLPKKMDQLVVDHQVVKDGNINNDNNVSPKVKKQELETTTGGSLLLKEMDQLVVDHQVDKDGNINNDNNVSPKVKKDFDNKEMLEGESKPTTSSSSSSQKPRTEFGGGGLLSGAKKLMGFKVVQEEVSSSSVVGSSDSRKQNKDNINEKKKKKNKNKKEEKEKEKEAPCHVVEDDRITGSQTQTSTSSVEEEQKTNVNAAMEAAASADHTSQSNTQQMTLQKQEMMVKNSGVDEIQAEKQKQQDDHVIAKQQVGEDSNNEEEGNRQRQEEEKKESREKTLSSEHTTTLRNYKDMKKKLSEENKPNNELQLLDDDIDQQLRALKIANALKDEEIQSLRDKIHHLQTLIKEPKVIIVKESFRVPSSSSRKADDLDNKDEDDDDDDDDDDDMKVASGRMMMMMAADEPVSEVEEKLRMEIDQVLEVNLDFWLRFSEALNQIQKYESVVEDLSKEISKLEEKVNSNKQQQDGSSHRSRTINLKSDLRPIYKHLSEIQTELTVWMDKCLMLKEEQQSRFSSLCDIQEEITKAVKASAEDEEFRFTSYQAAKFQGEVLNMKQENNKVANELQAGLDHITILQLDVDKTLNRLNDDYEYAPKNTQQLGGGGVSTLTHSPSRARVPLRSFIFGVKQKKRPSIFTCMTPAMHRKYNGLRVGF